MMLAPPPQPESGDRPLRAVAEERRRVAILVGDVAGFARLMELAELETHRRLVTLLEQVIAPGLAAHGGVMVKHTGDGFIARFDRPGAAAEAAVALKRRLAAIAEAETRPPLLFRLALHLTDAIVTADDVFGTGVNLAVRMQAAAEPGGLIVSAEIAGLLRDAPELRLVDLGLLSFKHISGGTACFAVHGLDETLPPRLPVAAEPAGASLAVLPFRKFLGGAAGDAEADGIVEAIVHSLSGIDDLFVIAHASVLAVAARSGDVQSIGRELGVRYVLTGSVHRAGLRLRILTELADCESGLVIRTGRQEGSIDALFDMQDRIAFEVIAAIAPTVRAHELARARGKRPDSLSAYDLVVQARALAHGFEREGFERARGMLQQAIAVDPNYAPAWSEAAMWHMFRIGQGWSRDMPADAAESARCAAAAIARDPRDARALAIHGHMLSYLHQDYAAASEALARAIAVGPSCALAWALSSATLGYLGDGPRAVAHAERAIRHSPLDPMGFFVEHLLSQAHYVNGDMARAVEWGRKAAAENGLLTSNLRTLAAALVAQEEMEAARRIAQRMLAIEPGFRLAAFAARTPIAPPVLGPYLERLRQAGLPD